MSTIYIPKGRFVFSDVKEWMAKKSKEEGYSRSRLPRFTNEETEILKGVFQFTATRIQQAERKF
jgi:hypothetical protein